MGLKQKLGILTDNVHHICLIVLVPEFNLLTMSYFCAPGNEINPEEEEGQEDGKCRLLMGAFGILDGKFRLILGTFLP